jgi:molecular chaperone HscB
MLDFSQNYFQLLGLPQSYHIDREQLQKNYRELQRVLHPDRYASASDQERRLSMQGATHINEAFETLKDPILRGNYLLLLHGIDAKAGAETTQDGAFLMEQMELREELSEAREQPDPYKVTARIMGSIRKQMEELMGQLELQFEQPDSDHLTAAQELLRKMQFLNKLNHDAEQLEAELDDSI